jgi:hypothetical protein
VPREADHEAQTQWLYGWWERIDAWITENRPGGLPVPAVAVAPEEGPAELTGDLPPGRPGCRPGCSPVPQHSVEREDGR